MFHVSADLSALECFMFHVSADLSALECFMSADLSALECFMSLLICLHWSVLCLC